MRLIGIGGTNGAGKDTLGEMLQERHGWLFISGSRDMLRPECERRGLPMERESLRLISAEWRKAGGLGVMVDKAVRMFEEKGGSDKYGGLVIASLRNPGEADEVHKLGGRVVWVDAEPRLRFQRVMKRNRSTEDAKTYEEFLAEEEAEMHSDSGEETALHMQQVKDRADIFIKNDGDDPEAFIAAAEKVLDLA